MKPTGYNEFREQLLGKPSVIGTGRCAVCGRLATNRHHVVPKGMGGCSAEVEDRIPKIELCGSGTTGCHGDVHAKLLHLHWFDGLGGWCVYRSPHPMDDQIAAQLHIREFKPLQGWVEQKLWGDVIGGRK